MKILIFLMALLTLTTQSSFAGGYAGNGGGLVEQNFNFAYTSLPRMIESVLLSAGQQFNLAESATLQNISKIALANNSNPSRLKFLSGAEHPDIFKTGPNEPHRLAVTSETPGDIIFINGDFLYSETGKPALSLDEMIAILVHEVGHQTGEKNHQYLDILGSKVRSYFSQNSLSYAIEKQSKKLVFTAINQKGRFTSGQLLFQNSEKSLNLTGWIIQKLNSLIQEKKLDHLTGYFLTNGNFKLELLPQRYVFQIWVNASFGAHRELIPIDFEILSDNAIQVLEQN